MTVNIFDPVNPVHGFHDAGLLCFTEVLVLFLENIVTKNLSVKMRPLERWCLSNCDGLSSILPILFETFPSMLPQNVEM